MLAADSADRTLHYAIGLLIVVAAGSLGGLIAAIGALVEGGRTEDGGQFTVTRGVSTRFST